jgi:hypothetical protein
MNMKEEHTEYTIVISAQERLLLIEAMNKLLKIEAESLQVPPKSYNDTLIAAAATPKQRQRIKQLCELRSVPPCGKAGDRVWQKNLPRTEAPCRPGVCCPMGGGENAMPRSIGRPRLNLPHNLGFDQFAAN